MLFVNNLIPWKQKFGESSECMYHAWMRAYVHACGCTHACTRACVSRVQMNDCVCAIHTQDLERLLSCEVWSAQEAIVTLEKVACGY